MNPTNSVVIVRSLVLKFIVNFNVASFLILLFNYLFNLKSRIITLEDSNWLEYLYERNNIAESLKPLLKYLLVFCFVDE